LILISFQKFAVFDVLKLNPGIGKFKHKFCNLWKPSLFPRCENFKQTPLTLMCCVAFSNVGNFTETDPKMEHVLETNVMGEFRTHST